MRKWLIFFVCLVMAMAVALVGCGSSEEAAESSSGETESVSVEEEAEEESTEEESIEEGQSEDPVSAETEEEEESPVENTGFSALNALKIEDLDWSFSYSSSGEEQFVSFDYTNNSNYVVLQFDIEFVPKDGVTADELISAFGDFIDKEIEEEYIEKIALKASNRKCADPGETVSDVPLEFDYHYSYSNVETMEQCDLMEPDNASIVFIGDDGYGYELYYDFATDTYRDWSNGGMDLHQPFENALAEFLPDIDLMNCVATAVAWDDEDHFGVYVYGVSEDEYNSYREAVKEAGYTNVVWDSDDLYRANDGVNAEVAVSYTDYEETMYIYVEPYDE